MVVIAAIQISIKIRALSSTNTKNAITGLLHDADYEAHPDKHPGVIVEELRNRGEDEIAHAIAGHYTKWNVPYETTLDKVLFFVPGRKPKVQFFVIIFDSLGT